MEYLNLIYAGVAILITVLVSSLFMKMHYTGKLSLLNEKIKQLLNENNLLSFNLENNQKEIITTNQKNITLSQEKALLQHDLANFSNQLSDYKSNEERQQKQFEYLAQQILTKSAKQVTDLHNRDIQTLLTPLSAEIKQYREKVEQNTLESAKGNASLQEQVVSLTRNTQLVSKQADKLVETLRKDYKKQGNWGEIILESILDKSGLTKNREYFIQPSVKDDLGRTKRPDVIIDLPDGKKLVIDSKVSLSAFDKLVNAGEEQDAKRHQKALTQALKTHICQLSEKNYHELYRMACPDFVFMFIPIDNAFSVALQEDNSLLEFALNKNIVVVTSSTLIAALKTVESLWRSDKQDRNALQIAEEAGKMYDKLVGVLDDMEKLGTQIKTATNTYDLAMCKFANGKGNLISKAEKIKSLGAKTNKVVAKGLLHKAV